MSGQPFGTAEELPELAPLSVVLALTDASGSTLRLEVDSHDGRTYITVGFDGHESPFELTPEAAGTIAGALWRYAAPVDLSGLRFVASSVGAVKPGKAPVKQPCMLCGGAGRPGPWPCGGCGRC